MPPKNNSISSCFFTGKEWCKSQWLAQRGPERGISETGYSYFGARYYDSDLSGLFMSIDPMVDKYPSITPLNTTHKSALRFRDTQSLPECPQDILLQELVPYCAWNPVKIVDPSGDTIKLAANSSEVFKEQFLDAIQYLLDNGASDIFESLNNREETIIIEELSYEEAYNTQFVPSENKIMWCPTAAMLTTEDVMLSPTISLNHEMDHCLEHLEHPNTQSQNYNKKIPGYRNAEGQRVITGSEQRTALQLGEIKVEQITRQDHSGTLYETECSTSNAPKYPNKPIDKPVSNRLKTVKIKPQ